MKECWLTTGSAGASEEDCHMGKIPMEKAMEVYNTIAAYCRQCDSCSDCLFGVYEAEGLESECIITLSPDPPQDWQELDLD